MTRRTAVFRPAVCRVASCLKVARLSGASLMVASLMAACSLAPDSVRPSVPTPTRYKEAADGWQPAVPADAAAKGDWWQAFGDSTLDTLEDQVMKDNPSLAAAVARFGEARASADYARAGLYPQLSVTGHADRLRRSQTLKPSIEPATLGDNLVSFSASWELDFWGRVRNTATAEADLARASASDLANVELGLRAELATDYLSLRGADSAQQILDDTADAEEKAYRLIVERHQGGIAALADVAEAETQWQSSRTQAADNHLKRQQYEHAIAILIGTSPADFSLPAVPLAARVPSIGLSLPSALLERRPDVAAAERRVEAANAQIGVARAAWYPTFDLAALAGFESATVPGWFKAPSAIWSLGPTVGLPLFDGGQRAAQSDQAHAAYDEAVANYRQTVLAAWRDVEDSLIALRQLEQEASSQSAAVSAAGTALQQARLRYSGGIVTYLEVVTNQNTALSAQLSALDIETRRVNAHVALVKALGGGWDARGDAEGRP